ncbi:MAG TPA: zinc dependent phospholipase C family protein [Bryobacteraceae bacterium]|nr:zinc dependent phospholipase C family protein [Bryobacteraceae bacterium]
MRLLLLFALTPAIHGYSVLTHQAIIDTAWKDSIEPALKSRFPAATIEQLVEAHAYAYGGSILQDMGYYPFGSKLFSDLVHYVRSGDFVASLLRQARDLDEYAFAVGALAHYAADTRGHPLAVNRAVPVLYPKLRSEYGEEVTYAENPAAHLKTEFGFDVLQVARGNYAPKAYRDFIGFKVSKDVLERSFAETYALELKDVMASVDLALGSYRYAVAHLVPESTKIAWELKQDEIVKATPGITREKFLYTLSRAEYRKEWGGGYERPGPFARAMALLFRLLPKIGPFKAVAFRPPTAETARLFMMSFNRTVEDYRGLLAKARRGRLDLVNLDFDTGRRVHPGEYPLADKTYGKLVIKLAERDFRGASPELRKNIADFYAAAPAPPHRSKEWRKTEAALQELKGAVSYHPGPPERPSDNLPSRP